MSWRPVVGYEGRYEVSDVGALRSLSRLVRVRHGTRMVVGRELVAGLMNAGYLVCALQADNVSAMRLVHRVVAAAFIGPCPPGHEVNHKNGVKTDNRAVNLEYVTRVENLRHAKRHGLLNNDGERNPMAKLTAAEVHAIRAAYCRGERGCGYKALGLRFGVSPKAVQAIIRRKTWASV
jgi:hypothetical protein